jgi:acyl carrier protein
VSPRASKKRGRASSRRAPSAPDADKRPARPRRRAVRSSRASTSDLDKVRSAILRVRPRLPESALKEKASLVADLGVDSLSFAELSIELENAFGRPIFLGDVLADLDDPAALTVGELASKLAEGT